MSTTPLKPHFPPSTTTPTPSSEPPKIQSLITTLALQPHIEGGYFTETDRDSTLLPSPFPPPPTTAPARPGFNPKTRNLSTTIFYLLTPGSPQGGFHRNAARTVHTLHRGRGVYVIIHADSEERLKPVEVFIVGQGVEKGEKLQWIVEGGKFKGTFLLPDDDDDDGVEGLGSGGLLISETVVPGFEYCDHDFLTEGGLEKLIGKEKKGELEWLLSPLGKGKE